MAKTINTQLLVALLLFLSAFFVANVSFLSGFYVRGVACPSGDVNHDGSIATETDVKSLKELLTSFTYIACGDLNKDSKIDSDDMNLLLSIKAREDAVRQNRGRYCANECPEGEKVCTAQDYVNSAGAVIQKGSNLYKVCGNYDEDPCLEWSKESFTCPTGSRCRPKNPGTDVCILANLAEENVLVTQY